MKILKIKNDVDNLRELRQRKAELKARLDAEKVEIRETWQTFRANLQPAKLAGYAIKSLLSPYGGSETNADQKALSLAASLRGPLKLAADLFVRDPRIALLLRFVAPLTLAYLPRIVRKAKQITPGKAVIYGTLRKGVAGVRKSLRLKKTGKTAPGQQEDTALPPEPES